VKTNEVDIDIEQKKAHYEVRIESCNSKILSLMGVIKKQCDAFEGDDSYLDFRVDTISQMAAKLPGALGELKMYKALLLQLKEISAVNAV
jgi:hypothetical protein